MKIDKKLIFIYLSLSLFLIDRFLKTLAQTKPNFNFFLIKNYLGWQFTLNPGVAFGLPINWLLSTSLSLIFLISFIVYLIIKKQKLQSGYFLGISLVLLGALSNFIDRLIFKKTIDYFIFLFSIINVADIMIVFGLLIILFHLRFNKELRIKG